MEITNMNATVTAMAGDACTSAACALVRDEDISSGHGRRRRAKPIVWQVHGRRINISWS
eukprot:jgi/Mesvir1/8186/Mv12483-RA.1